MEDRAVGPPTGRVLTALRAASVMYVVLGLGFGVGQPSALASALHCPSYSSGFRSGPR